MASLSDHLRASSSHGRLPFHRGCPVCREERLSGKLAADALLTPRGRAGLLAATIAASSLTAPTVALADGVTVGATGHASQLSDGEQDGISADDGRQADIPAAEDDAPLEEADLIAPDLEAGREEPPPSPLSGLPADEAGAGDPLVESRPEPEPDPPLDAEPVQPVPESPPPVAPPGPDTELRDQEPTDHPRSEARPLRWELQGGRHERAQQPATAPAGTAPERPGPAVAAAVPGTSTAVSTRMPTAASHGVSSRLEALARGRSYTVRAGDSLWSIAQRLLGRDASVARVAVEVNRLWDLNRERIATGDPSLLRVGTELRL